MICSTIHFAFMFYKDNVTLGIHVHEIVNLRTCSPFDRVLYLVHVILHLDILGMFRAVVTQKNGHASFTI